MKDTDYIIKNPSLHEEDSSWKVSKIIPLVDIFFDYIKKDEINLLDAGGGAGLILNAISSYIEKTYATKVNKFALDLSPEILEIQKKKNPDLKKLLNEDIRKTSLGDKEVDLAMTIDLLEHVPNPEEALKEVRRISKFVIFKVPLEYNLFTRILNLARRGRLRQQIFENLGHVNIYEFSGLKKQIERYTGKLLYFYFTDVFDYLLTSADYIDKMNLRNKLINFAAAFFYRLSPRFCSFIFGDFVMLLVKCY